jgi:hypothetical protein
MKDIIQKRLEKYNPKSSTEELNFIHFIKRVFFKMHVS